jgi:hypothetical protein
MCKKMRLMGRGTIERKEDDWMRCIFGNVGDSDPQDPHGFGPSRIRIY